VDKDGHSKLFAGGEELEKPRLAEVKLFDVRPDLNAG
jgi:hypothetical protein